MTGMTQNIRAFSEKEYASRSDEENPIEVVKSRNKGTVTSL